MSSIKIEIEIRGHCSYVPDYTLEDHLKDIAEDIEKYAKALLYEDWYRKIQIDYEEQETVDLCITVGIK